MLIGVRTVRSMFRAAHRVAGRPTLSIIPPVGEWVLPTGVTYDAYRDKFINGSGVPVAVAWADQAVTVADYLPDRAMTGLTFGMTGVTTEDTTNVALLWDEETEAALRAAWGIAIDDNLYRVSNVDRAPQGVTTAYLLQVSLKQGILEK